MLKGWSGSHPRKDEEHLLPMTFRKPKLGGFCTLLFSKPAEAAGEEWE